LSQVSAWSSTSTTKGRPEPLAWRKHDQCIRCNLQDAVLNGRPPLYTLIIISSSGRKIKKQLGEVFRRTRSSTTRWNLINSRQQMPIRGNRTAAYHGDNQGPTEIILSLNDSSRTTVLYARASVEN
jgi:hypothetical protein